MSLLALIKVRRALLSAAGPKVVLRAVSLLNRWRRSGIPREALPQNARRFDVLHHFGQDAPQGRRNR